MNVTQASAGSDFDAILGLSAIAMLIVSVILVRSVILRSVSRFMYARSDEVGSEHIPGGAAPETKASHRPRLVEWRLDAAPDAAAQRREHHVQRALGLFRRAYLLVFVACAGYAVIPWLFGALAGYSPTPEPVWGAMGLSALYFVSIPSTRYWLYRKQFRALDARLGFRLELPSITISRALLAPKNEGYIVGIFIGLMTIIGLVTTLPSDPSAEIAWHFPAVGVGIFLAVALHLGLMLVFWTKRQKDANLKLVILRVFGLDETARFTFGGILRFWQHFGSYFTVVDPSYMKHRHRLWSWRSLYTMVGVGLVWIGSIAALAIIVRVDDQAYDRFFNTAALPMGVATLGAFAGAFYWRVRRSFARSEMDIQARIARLLKRPRSLGMNFKGLPLACFDNTWRLAVKEFVTNADVVLMDLRGFSRERKGCEYEVDFLFDNVTISQVVFLVDSEVDRDAVQALILDRWEYLRVTSPNHDADDPVARIYVSGDQKQRDMQGLTDILLLVATRAEEMPAPV